MIDSTDSTDRPNRIAPSSGGDPARGAAPVDEESGRSGRRPSGALVRWIRAAASGDGMLSSFVYMCDKAISGSDWALDRIAAMFTEDDLRRPSAFLRLLMKGVSRDGARPADHGEGGCDDVRCGARPDCAGVIAVVGAAIEGAPRRNVVCKADPALSSDPDLPGQIIDVTMRIDGDFDPEADAEAIAAALWGALPGATCDRLLEAMLRRRASLLRVARSRLPEDLDGRGHADPSQARADRDDPGDAT